MEKGKMESSRNRIEWIDFAKGLTIFLVIIGHSVGPGELRGLIYSFHMPLYFILSCITYKLSENEEQFSQRSKRAFKHLIMPVIVVFAITTMIDFSKNLNSLLNANDFLNFIRDKALTFLYASGVNITVNDIEIKAIGMLWFLVVFFEARTLFDYLHLKLGSNINIVLCLLLSVAGVILGMTKWLPLSFDIVLAIMPFFLVGVYFHYFHVENRPWMKFALSASLWLIMMIAVFVTENLYLEFACRRYSLFPLCYIIGICGTIMVSEFSVIACKVRFWAKPIEYLGENALYMLCIHSLDYYVDFTYNITANIYINAIMRIMIDCIIFALFMLLRRVIVFRKND